MTSDRQSNVRRTEVESYIVVTTELVNLPCRVIMSGLYATTIVAPSVDYVDNNAQVVCTYGSKASMRLSSNIDNSIVAAI